MAGTPVVTAMILETGAVKILALPKRGEGGMTQTETFPPKVTIPPQLVKISPQNIFICTLLRIAVSSI